MVEPVGLLDPDLRIAQNIPEKKWQAVHQIITGSYLQSDVGLSGRGTNSLLDDEIKAYMKKKIRLHLVDPLVFRARAKYSYPLLQKVLMAVLGFPTSRIRSE